MKIELNLSSEFEFEFEAGVTAKRGPYKRKRPAKKGPY